MRNTIGDNVRLTLFGESHNEIIGAVLDGMCPGIKVDEEFIKLQLKKRRPMNGETPRIEIDDFKIVSGVFNGYTTGESICLLIENHNTRSQDYEEIKSIARPSHADYVAHVKYHGFNDYRGGGHFSGRITAPIVAVGSIVLKALEKKNIYIGTHIKKCGNVVDQDFLEVEKEVKELSGKIIPVISNIEEDIQNEILNVKKEKDSIGGILQTAIIGLPVGLGQPWFSSVEGKIANAVFSIGGVKGIEFGAGFNFANLKGSSCNDQFEIVNEKVITKTNNNAGINGGITNGMPIVFNTAIKPTPSIGLSQDTIDFVKDENVETKVTGRHDPAIVRRIAVVIDSIVALVVADLLSMRYGEDFLEYEE